MLRCAPHLLGFAVLTSILLLYMLLTPLLLCLLFALPLRMALTFWTEADYNDFEDLGLWVHQANVSP